MNKILFIMAFIIIGLSQNSYGSVFPDHLFSVPTIIDMNIDFSPPQIKDLPLSNPFNSDEDNLLNTVATVINPIPEPSAVVIFVTGLFVLVGVGMIKRKKTSNTKK